MYICDAAGAAHWAIHSHSYVALRVIVMLARCINHMYIFRCVCVCTSHMSILIYMYIYLLSGIHALGDPLPLLRGTTPHRYAGKVHKQYIYI